MKNKVRFELNFQRPLGDPAKALLPEAKYTGDQLEGRITLWGLVNKIDYTFRFLNGRLDVKPQFKVRTVKEVRLGYVNVGGELRKVPDIIQHTQEMIPHQVFLLCLLNRSIHLHFVCSQAKMDQV